MHAELRGPLSLESLQAALAAVQRRHPLLRVRIVEDEEGTFFVEDGVGPIPLRHVEGPHADWHAEFEYELKTRLDWTNGPLARCVWITGEADTSTLLVTFHHSIGDASSGTYLIRDVLQACGAVSAGESRVLEPLPPRPALDQELPPEARGWRGLGRFVSAIGRMRLWFARHGQPVELPPDAPKHVIERQACVSLKRLEPELTRVLVTRARREGTTVQGALSAAIALAAAEEWPNGRTNPMVFGFIADLRDRLVPPIADDIGLYVSLGFGLHLVSCDRPLWELAREMKREVTRFIETGAPFVFLPWQGRTMLPMRRLYGRGEQGVARLGHFLVRTQLPALGLTNIGRVPIKERYGPLEIQAVGFCPSLSVLSNCGVAAATIQDRLCLNFVGMQPVVTRERLERVAERSLALLGKALE